MTSFDGRGWPDTGGHCFAASDHCVSSLLAEEIDRVPSGHLIWKSLVGHRTRTVK